MFYYPNAAFGLLTFGTPTLFGIIFVCVFLFHFQIQKTSFSTSQNDLFMSNLLWYCGCVQTQMVFERLSRGKGVTPSLAEKHAFWAITVHFSCIITLNSLGETRVTFSV
jgi:hypothetical protein